MSASSSALSAAHPSGGNQAVLAHQAAGERVRILSGSDCGNPPCSSLAEAVEPCLDQGVSEVTRILESIEQGNSKAAEELLPVVYEELRKLAAARMSEERETSTLQATALVHEAWLRLVGGQQQPWQSRGHFFAAAAEAMRRILIDNARRKQAQKRGSRAEHLDLDRLDLAVEADEESLLAINEALERLSAQDPQAAQLVKLRFFVGLSYDDSAKSLGISERTAKRYWTFARAWLYRELSRHA